MPSRGHAHTRTHIHICRHKHTQTPTTNTCIKLKLLKICTQSYTNTTRRPTRNAYTFTFSHSHSLQLFLSFTLFCFYLQGIISLSNPFPYIKCCFLLRLASSTHCTSCWQHRCFPQKTPSQSWQGDGKERETVPSGTTWKISSFFVSPLKEDRLLFQLLFGECHWTKQASSADDPAFGVELFRYLERQIRWESFV